MVSSCNINSRYLDTLSNAGFKHYKLFTDTNHLAHTHDKRYLTTMINQIKQMFSKPDPNKTYYKLMGEEMGTYELVKTFYEIMESDPKAKDCLNVHSLTENNKIPDEVKKKLFMFLCGWMGGPNLFVETYGPPKMRARHLGFPIGLKEAEQWLYCMNLALDRHSSNIHKTTKLQMHNSFKALASRIVNKN